MTILFYKVVLTEILNGYVCKCPMEGHLRRVRQGSRYAPSDIS